MKKAQADETAKSMTAPLRKLQDEGLEEVMPMGFKMPHPSVDVWADGAQELMC